MLTQEEKQKITPMMKEYLNTKEKYQDCVLFYRLGDFYEMFFEDAILVSRILELTLTGKDCGLEYRAPMCGIPYHAANAYIPKLIENNIKVAIAEQQGEPVAGKIMERKVVRIITPGTVLDNESLDDKKNNYIAVIYKAKNGYGICHADISTGFMETASFSGERALSLIDDTLATIKPSETISNEEFLPDVKQLVCVKTGIVNSVNAINPNYFSLARATANIKNQFNIKNLATVDLSEDKCATIAAGALLDYLEETQMQSLSNIKSLKKHYSANYMHLDITARKNLELTENMHTRKKQGSLLWLLDSTKCAMGARKLRQYVENPLINETEINKRLDAIEELSANVLAREGTTELFAKITDVERICGKIAIGSVTPKDCFSLCETLLLLPQIKQAFSSFKSEYIIDALKKLKDVHELAYMLVSAFDEKAPVNYKEGGFIKAGYNETLDRYRDVPSTIRNWIVKYEADERAKTGIKTLKISFNRVFGYYIEVTKSYYSLIPENYILKQTLLDSQKFITDELKEEERELESSSALSLDLELKLYEEIKEHLFKKIGDLLDISEGLASLDAICSLARVSCKNNYIRPLINKDVGALNITAGRHPVIEAYLGAGEFVDNDTMLDNAENNILIITGPNMGGKSTYMRQVALITLMAHIGCFVPAKSASIPITDRIFTRIGASDDISMGSSTFMVEMTEMANIVLNATEKSLLILDEVGRGTSTFDGMSIAYAIIEYLAKNIKAKTLFATHYHELTILEGRLPGIKNYRVLVKEFNGSVIFLHKIARGSANRSFGIEVASLAGLPESLVARAKEVLASKEMGAIKVEATKADDEIKLNPCALEVINVLKDMDLNTITPIMAFGTLQNLVDKVKNN